MIFRWRKTDPLEGLGDTYRLYYWTGCLDLVQIPYSLGYPKSPEATPNTKPEDMVKVLLEVAKAFPQYSEYANKLADDYAKAQNLV